MIAKHENAVLSYLGFSYVFSAFFKNEDARVFCLSLQKCFKACFASGYAGVLFAGDYLFEDTLPSVYVCLHIVELCAVDFDVQWRIWRTV